MKKVVAFLCILILFGEMAEAVELTLKAGLSKQQLSGSIDNINAKSTFENDFAYDTTDTSTFSLELRDIYIPNIKILYFNIQESASNTLQQDIVVAQNSFAKGSDIFSEIEYKQLNALFYEDFLFKGDYLFANTLYSGDLEIDLGLNAQYTQWNFDVESLTNPTQPKAWIHIKSNLISPYIAFKYYVSHIQIELFGDALAYKDEKVIHYGGDIQYHFERGIILSVGYTYNEFELTEKEDDVTFNSYGVDFMFGYRF